MRPRLPALFRKRPPRREFPQPAISYAELRGLSEEGFRALLDRSPEQAAAIVRTAAVYGFAYAQVVFGQMLLDGHGVAQDIAAACRWFLSAAEAGHPDGINMVGRCHEHGWGVARDHREAAAWFRKAVDAGSDWGRFNLATMLLAGEGVARDRAGALALAREAAENGHVKAMTLLGRFLEEGWETARDPAAAQAWYRRAADGGDCNARYNLATLAAREGRQAEALRWFRAAAQSGYPDFVQDLAAMLIAAADPAYRALGLAIREGRLASSSDGAGPDSPSAPAVDPKAAWSAASIAIANPEAGKQQAHGVRP